MSPTISHKWREISGLPEDLEPFRDRELESLREVWDEQKTAAGEEERIAAFHRELNREWSIETGIIEGVYTLDRGTTQILIRRGIDSSYISHESTNQDPELVARVVRAHEEVLDGLFAFVKGERRLTVSYIRELHAALLQHIDTVAGVDQFGNSVTAKLEKGEYKKWPNNPTRRDGSVHEYCPPEHVASEMDRLIDLHSQHEKRGVPPLIEAAWLHHAFAQVHPFQDGNGRVARALASLVLIKAGFFPIVVRRDDREKYIDCLEAADAGDLSQLIGFFGRLQKRDLTRAITYAMETKPVASADEAIELTAEILRSIGRIGAPEHVVAKRNADEIVKQTTAAFEAARSRLAAAVASLSSQFSFATPPGSGPNAAELAFLRWRFGYEPNVADYSRTVTLLLREKAVASETISQIVVTFNTVGRVFRGLIAAVPYFKTGEFDPIPLSDEVFRIYYKEPTEELEKRYAKWLDDVLVRGLAEWRKTLA